MAGLVSPPVMSLTAHLKPQNRILVLTFVLLIDVAYGDELTTKKAFHLTRNKANCVVLWHTLQVKHVSVRCHNTTVPLFG